MFEYLEPRNGPVVDGLEEYEIVYASDQPEYVPLRTLTGANGMSAVSRWTFTEEQRKAIAEGADVYLENFHFGEPLSPVRMAIGKPEGKYWNAWFAAQISTPFPVEI